MKKIEKLLLELKRGVNEPIGSLPTFYYGLADFKLDLLENTSLDWKIILEDAKFKISSYLGAVLAYNENLKDVFKIDGLIQLDKPVEKTSSIDPLGLLSEASNQTLEGWLSHHIEAIQECLDYYEENKNSPPFSYPVQKENKIPFWGTQDEFMSLINLLENGGIFFGTNRMNFKEKFGYSTLFSNVKHKEKVRFVNLDKVKFIDVLSNFFYLIQLENGDFQEEPINPSTVFKKMNDTSFQKLAAEKKKDMIIFFREILDSIDPDYDKPKYKPVV